VCDTPRVQTDGVEQVLAGRVPDFFLGLEVLETDGTGEFFGLFAGSQRRHEDFEVVQVG